MSNAAPLPKCAKIRVQFKRGAYRRRDSVRARVKIPVQFKRGPDRRSDSVRGRVRILRIRKKCPKCENLGRRGWAKGFCLVHATMQGLENPDPRRNHDTKGNSISRKKLKLKSTNAKERKPGLGAQKKLKRVKNSKKIDSHGRKLSPFPRNASNPYYWERNKKNKAARVILKVEAARVAKAGEKNGGKKQNGGRKFERFTPRFEKQVPVTTFSPRRWPKQRVAVESDSEFEFGKNCEFKLLKPLAAAFDDELVEPDAEFHSWSDEPQRRSS